MRLERDVEHASAMLIALCTEGEVLWAVQHLLCYELIVSKTTTRACDIVVSDYQYSKPFISHDTQLTNLVL